MHSKHIWQTDSPAATAASVVAAAPPAADCAALRLSSWPQVFPCAASEAWPRPASRPRSSMGTLPHSGTSPKGLAAASVARTRPAALGSLPPIPCNERKCHATQSSTFRHLQKFQGTNRDTHSCYKWNLKLDVDPRRDDDASLMSSYGCMLRPTRMISALRNKSKFNFELRKKKQVKIQFQIF